MQITINGQTKDFSGTANLYTVISQFCKDSSRVIAELNGNIVKKTSWDSTSIKDGDSVELVSFVGGG